MEPQEARRQIERSPDDPTFRVEILHPRRLVGEDNDSISVLMPYLRQDLKRLCSSERLLSSRLVMVYQYEMAFECHRGVHRNCRVFQQVSLPLHRCDGIQGKETLDVVPADWHAENSAGRMLVVCRTGKTTGWRRFVMLVPWTCFTLLR